MSPAAVGVALALLFGVAGGLGTFLSGVIADRLGKRDIRWNLYVPIIFLLLALPCFPFFFLSNSRPVMLAFAILPAANGAAYLGPVYAMTQSLVPLRMRAQAAAILLFILNIIGFGTGPLIVGKISDLLAPTLGINSLRWALLLTAIPWALSGLCYWAASRTLHDDLGRSEDVPGARAVAPA
jgi:MFS family permease